MTTYKKTVKKYNNKKPTTSISKKTQNINNKTKKLLNNDKNNYSTGNKLSNTVESKLKKNTSISNSEKPENIVSDKYNNHPQNSNLYESQDHDILSYKKDKFKSVTYCIISAIITIIAIILIKNNIFNKTFTSNDSDLWIINHSTSVTFFFVFYACCLMAVCLLTLSNKTDNHAYEIDIVLYSILLIMCFTLSLLLYNFELFLPSAIISIISTALSIYMSYRYYVSFFWSGTMQSIASLFLLYSTYVTLGLTL